MNKRTKVILVIIVSLFVVFIVLPRIFSMFNDTRRREAKSYALRYIDGIEYYTDYLQAQEETIITQTCIKKNNVWSSQECKDFYSTLDKLTSAKIPTNAVIEINIDGKVKTNSSFTYNGYKYIYK